MTRSPWTWQVIRAGTLRLDGGGMFGIIPKEMWSRWTPPDEHNRIDLQTNCMLFEQDGRKVLVESGCGDKWTSKEREIYDLEQRTVVDALREIEVEPEEIDTVIVTHLHFDHAAGLTTWDGRPPREMIADGISPRPVFPNADIVVQRKEWEDAVANRSTMTRTYLRTHLDPIADRIRLIDGHGEVLPGITVEPVIGHTPGQQGVLVNDSDRTIAFLGDLLPTVHHAHPSAATAYDMEPYETLLTKARILQRADDEDWTIILDHESGDPVVRVIRDERGRRTLGPRNPA